MKLEAKNKMIVTERQAIGGYVTVTEGGQWGAAAQFTHTHFFPCFPSSPVP
jgi:hypothetical protein